MRHFANQLVRVITTLLAVCFLINVLLYFMPGDPAAIVAGDLATPEQIEKVRKDLHLDEGLLTRYVEWVALAVQGNLGISLVNKPGASVLGLIAERIPVTLQVTGFALILAVLIALPAGVAAAVRPGSWPDRLITAIGSIALAIPGFVVGVVLVSILAVKYAILPSAGFVSPFENLGEWFTHLVMPALALAAVPAAELARQTRGAMVDVFQESFIRTARASGLPRWVVILKHAGKAAAPPVLTVFGLQAAFLLGGAIVIEQIFVLPGLGSLAYDAVLIRDIPLIQGVVIAGAVIVLTVNLLVDVALYYLVPKSR
ncbi:MAG: ABC transporter permease [Casimicrobiaceae bacterium]